MARETKGERKPHVPRNKPANPTFYKWGNVIIGLAWVVYGIRYLIPQGDSWGPIFVGVGVAYAVFFWRVFSRQEKLARRQRAPKKGEST